MDNEFKLICKQPAACSELWMNGEKLNDVCHAEVCIDVNGLSKLIVTFVPKSLVVEGEVDSVECVRKGVLE